MLRTHVYGGVPVEGITDTTYNELVPNILGVINFWKEKYSGHKIVDDQNVGSHKMTTDSVFILFKKTDFNTILA